MSARPRRESKSRWSTSPQRWAALQARSGAADGAFVYAVRTTGVYCRPGCRSRRPRRENVRFFDSPQQAERSGFRACRRCRPNQPADAGVAALVRAVCARIEASAVSIPLADLSAQAGMSPYHLQRLFKRAVGLTPKQYELSLRTQQFRRELHQERTVTQAMYRAGYGSASRAYDGARRRLGMTPRAFQRGGEGMTIRYAVARSSVGGVLVAATRAGVCAIELGDSAATLRRRLRAQFPRAVCVAGGTAEQRQAAALAEYIRRPEGPPRLSLDLRGSDFQIRVWEALRAIPPGRTATYRQVAEAIGAPRAARAVARACAANRLAVAVPCHRVIRADGALGGYRWGMQRKRALLEREAGGATGET